jgi:hypothetical protein
MLYTIAIIFILISRSIYYNIYQINTKDNNKCIIVSNINVIGIVEGCGTLKYHDSDEKLIKKAKC